MQAPFPAVLELREQRETGSYIVVRSLVVDHGTRLFIDIAEPGQRPPFTRRGTIPLAQVAWDARESVYRLQNIGDTPWAIISGGNGIVAKGASRRGLLLSFGQGKRLAQVVE